MKNRVPGVRGAPYWTDARIEQALSEAIVAHHWTTMPSCARMAEVLGSNSLPGAITKHGGMDRWAERMGLATLNHDSRRGWAWEVWMADQARLRGLRCEERDRVKAAVDMHVNGRSVEVKSAVGSWIAGGMQWTWRIGRRAHVADLYALVALTAGDPPVLFIVPAVELPLTCTTTRIGGKLWRWRDRWDLFE